MPTRLIACLIALIFVLSGFVLAVAQQGPPVPPMAPPAMPPSLADDDAEGPPPPPSLPPMPPANGPNNERPGKPRTPPPIPSLPVPAPGNNSNDTAVDQHSETGEIAPIEPAVGRDYTMYKGDPAHTGYIEERVQFPLKLAWKYLSEVAPENPSSPAVKDGVIYFASGTRFYAVNAETGTLRWRYPASESLTATIRTSPVVGDGMVYFGAGDGRLYAISTEDGSLVWSFVTRSNISSSPVLVDGVIYFGSDDRKLYALDAKTGAMKPKWFGGFNTKDGIAAPAAVSGNLIYFLSSDTVLYAANTISAQLSWATRVGAGSRQTTPVVADNTVYLAGGNTLYALQSKSSRLKWSVQLPGEITTTPAVAKNVIYFAFKDGGASKICAFTSAGKLKWKEAVEIGAPSYSSPIVTEDMVVITANKGIILALDSETGDVKWKYTVTPSILEYGSQRYKLRYVNLVAAPVIANGVLYVLADDGALHAFSMDSPDSTAPRVETVRPLRNFLMPGVPPVEIAAQVKDQGSGIREDTIKLTLDGELLPHQFIPERGIIWYKTPRTERLVPLSSGRHTASLSVEDWAGNKTYEEWTFMVDNTLRTTPRTQKSTTSGGSGGASGAAPPSEAPPPGFGR